MQKTDFNDKWTYRRLGENGEWKAVSLPHDAMICENRSENSEGGLNIAWFEAYDYEYRKTFFVGDEQKNKIIIFEFEGVYRNAEVYINGNKLIFHAYGYTGFYVDATECIKFGQDNDIRVIARNADQPNSRWYSGAGIYRPVYMYTADSAYILPTGVKIRTTDIFPAKISAEIKTSTDGEVEVRIVYKGNVVAQEKKHTENNKAAFEFTIEDAALWSVDTPELYECKVLFGNDVVTEKFGIRKIECSAAHGLTINGERVLLRGACIHHDNGILGSRCFAEAEYRKVALLKQNGYNAIRSAHNPCSEFLLEACDEMGMLVLDEYADMWYIHKTRYDYAEYLPDMYEQDITDMIDKDFNHPSVIMYSLGNEVAESGQKQGIELLKKMYAVAKDLDPDRPITVGVNIFFNLLYALGFGMYSDKKAKKTRKKKVGSEFFNDLTGLFGDTFMKNMAKLHGCDVKTRDCFAVTDVAGYNYGILRYKKDLKKYKDRIILGTETFCSDAYMFNELAKDNERLIGDFVWAGMDYLGETGIGSWEYRDYAPDFSHGVGWMSAGSGRIDLVGNALAEALYTKVAFGLSDGPFLAVVPVNHTNDKHSPSAWKFSNAICSWSWNGLNGKRARVEVYSRAPIVELYINGKRVGRKKMPKNNCRVIFEVKYSDGEVRAVNLDKNGKELSSNRLRTAGDETEIDILPEKQFVDRGEVFFVKLDYTDGEGTVKPLERGTFEVTVTGGELLAVGSGCPYSKYGYCEGKTETYYGRAMAVIKAIDREVSITVTDGKRTVTKQIVCDG